MIKHFIPGEFHMCTQYILFVYIPYSPLKFLWMPPKAICPQIYIFFSVYNPLSLISAVSMCIDWDHPLEQRLLPPAVSWEEKLTLLPLAVINYHKLLSYVVKAQVSQQPLLGCRLPWSWVGCASNHSFCDFMSVKLSCLPDTRELNISGLQWLCLFFLWWFCFYGVFVSFSFL